MEFNSAASTIMHIDINSCFATIEQQANPFLRGKPIAVAAYVTNYGCILAASYEAKRLGVKTGMRVIDGKLLASNLIVLSPDPSKYRYVHLKLRHILNKYSYKVFPKSIDEFSIDFKNTPVLEIKTMQEIALEIKKRIKEEIGEWITVSIGIATNRYLAKTAASYKKPDGLFEINKMNFKEVFESLKLTDLCGIKRGNASRLSTVSIFSVLDFYNADIPKLKLGFHSITGYYWYLRLHGYEVDDAIFTRKSFGNSYALPRELAEKGMPAILPIITKLTEKMSKRLRNKGLVAQGVHLGILFKDSYWHKGNKLSSPIFASNDFYKEILKLLSTCPEIKLVRNIAVSCFDLKEDKFSQLDLTTDILKKQNLTKALDKINNRYGSFTISSARMINSGSYVIDRIAFGGMSEI